MENTTVNPATDASTSTDQTSAPAPVSTSTATASTSTAKTPAPAKRSTSTAPKQNAPAAPKQKTPAPTPAPRKEAAPASDAKLDALAATLEKVRVTANQEIVALKAQISSIVEKGRADERAAYLALWTAQNAGKTKKWDETLAALQGQLAVARSKYEAEYRKFFAAMPGASKAQIAKQIELALTDALAPITAKIAAHRESDPRAGIEVPTQIAIERIASGRASAPRTSTSTAKSSTSTSTAPATTGNGPYVFTFTITEPQLVKFLSSNPAWKSVPGGISYTFQPRSKKNPPKYDFTAKLISHAPAGIFTEAQLENIAKSAQITVS